jgi:L-lactate dehydrogenase complex protein LldG
MSRDQILAAVLKNQPERSPLPDIDKFGGKDVDVLEKYVSIFREIGGTAFLVDDIGMIKSLIKENFDTSKRILTTLSSLSDIAELYPPTADPHTLEDVELAVIKTELAVAENGAVWLTEELMGQRIVPYICQHLAVIVEAKHIVPTLHEAYQKIGVGDYGFGGFIGGPSKTADIEQALVMGAHGPITMTVFILK